MFKKILKWETDTADFYAIENKHGILLHLTVKKAKYIPLGEKRFEVSFPIKPNTKTGSIVKAMNTDNWGKAMEYIWGTMTHSYPHWFTPEQEVNTQFLTMSEFQKREINKNYKPVDEVVWTSNNK